MAKKDEDTDPRHVARADEEARQQAVADAVAASNEAERAAAEKALEDQRYYETTGIRRVEGKP